MKRVIELGVLILAVNHLLLDASGEGVEGSPGFGRFVRGSPSLQQAEGSSSIEQKESFAITIDNDCKNFRYCSSEFDECIEIKKSGYPRCNVMVDLLLEVTGAQATLADYKVDLRWAAGKVFSISEAFLS